MLPPSLQPYDDGQPWLTAREPQTRHSSWVQNTGGGRGPGFELHTAYALRAGGSDI